VKEDALPAFINAFEEAVELSLPELTGAVPLRVPFTTLVIKGPPTLLVPPPPGSDGPMASYSLEN
jgi:hypothetical protein